MNRNTQNLASLHTTAGCTMEDGRAQSGKTISTNCDASANFNQGCGTSFSSVKSYGSGFNDNGGGWYVMWKSREYGIRVWFWARGDGSVPNEVVAGGSKLRPSGMWGMPDASFPTQPGQCDYNEHFDAHMMIFDLTFCVSTHSTSCAHHLIMFNIRVTG